MPPRDTVGMRQGTALQSLELLVEGLRESLKYNRERHDELRAEVANLRDRTMDGDGQPSHRQMIQANTQRIEELQRQWDGQRARLWQLFVGIVLSLAGVIFSLLIQATKAPERNVNDLENRLLRLEKLQHPPNFP